MKKFFKPFLPFSPLLFLGSITTLLFYKVIFLGQVFYDGFDNFNYIAPAKFFLISQIHHGLLPLWNPYIFTGIPYFADPTLGTLSIFTLLYFILPVYQAITLISILCIFLIGCFQYLFLRIIKISRFGSLFGALVFAFAGNVFITIGAVDVISVIVYIPLLFYSLYALYQKRQVRYIFLLTFFQSLQILSGHPRTVYYTVFFVSFFLLLWSGFAWKKRMITLLFYWSFSLLLPAIQLFPFIESVFLSNRPLSNFTYASSSSLTLPQFITFLFPTFFGTHLSGTWWGPQFMLFGYMGVPAYLLLVVGLLRGKIVRKSYVIIGMFLALFLAIGKISPIYVLFYYIIPGWKFFRSPIDIMVFFTFFATILAAGGFDYVLQNPTGIRNFCKKYVSLVVSFCSISVVGFVYPSLRSNFWKIFFLHLYQQTHSAILSRILIYDDVKLQTMFQGITANIVLLLLSCLATCCIIIFFTKNKRYLACGLITLTAFIFIYFDNQAVETASLSFTTNIHAPTILRNANNGQYRVLSLPIDLHQQREHLVISNFFYKEAVIKLAILQGNTNVLSNISQINANSPLIPSSLAQYMSGVGGDVTTVDFTHVTKQQLDEASVKYIISHDPIASFPAQLILIQKDATRYIYENPTAKSRFYLLHNMYGSRVHVDYMNSQKIVLHVTLLVPDNLIITDLYYPGWQATVNNTLAKIHPYKNTFQMVYIPKGVSTVTLAYKPASFAIGLVVSIVAILLFVGLFIVVRKRKL